MLIGNGAHIDAFLSVSIGQELSPGVMEGARRCGRGKEVLMLQSTLFYVLAIGGFREFPLQDEGCGLSSG